MYVVKTRKHHNNKRYRGIKNGTVKKEVDKIAYRILKNSNQELGERSLWKKLEKNLSEE